MNSTDMADALGQFPTATLYEAAGKCGDMDATIRPVVPGAKLAGVAVTVRVWPGDTLAVLREIDRAPAGSVIVIDAGAGDRAAVWGGTSCNASKVRGIRGCVTNGCVRDVDEIIELKFPIFSRGISPRGTLKNHPGWRNLPISVGGATVNPGDYIIGDTDGVVVVAAGQAEEVLAKAKAQRAKEADRDARVLKGEALTTILGLPPE